MLGWWPWLFIASSPEMSQVPVLKLSSDTWAAVSWKVVMGEPWLVSSSCHAQCWHAVNGFCWDPLEGLFSKIIWLPLESWKWVERPCSWTSPRTYSPQTMAEHSRNCSYGCVSVYMCVFSQYTLLILGNRVYRFGWSWKVSIKIVSEYVWMV
jgi:hypothetical protein